MLFCAKETCRQKLPHSGKICGTTFYNIWKTSCKKGIIYLSLHPERTQALFCQGHCVSSLLAPHSIYFSTGTSSWQGRFYFFSPIITSKFWIPPPSEWQPLHWSPLLQFLNRCLLCPQYNKQALSSFHHYRLQAKTSDFLKATEKAEEKQKSVPVQSPIN